MLNSKLNIQISKLHFPLLCLLASQFIIVQLLTAPLFGDAPRNLHWGILATENPAFLAGAPDMYERIKGFAPDPASLAQRDLWKYPPGSMHRWWGPFVPLLIGAVWMATHSYVAIQLIIPLAGAVTVLLSYVLARDMLDARHALFAALFLSCFPIFREYASTSYSEAFSACILTAAFWAIWKRRYVLIGALTLLAALTKMDLLFFLAGVAGISIIYDWLKGQRWQAAFSTLAIAIGLLLAWFWIWDHYLGAGESSPTRGFSVELFMIIMPQMIELLFYIPWYGALITLAAVGFPVFMAFRSKIFSQRAKLFLGSWLGLGLIVLLIYAATPGAGNSPRVLIPALPPLAILFVGGFDMLATRWRQRIGFYLVVIFAIVGLVVTVYNAASGTDLRSRNQLWQELRAQPQGFVLTDKYWETILFTRQKATWFEGDERFQQNIMHNSKNFEHYVRNNPIRYVVLPLEGKLASDDVRAYLNTNAKRTELGQFLLYTLP